MLKTFLLMPLAAVFQGGAAQEAIAPQEPTERKVRIEIVTTENGETKRATKEFDAASDQEMHEALKELGVLDHINFNGDGENVTIDIRRSGGEADDDIFLHMAPMPPMPPMPTWAGTCDPTAYLGVGTRTIDADLAKEMKLPMKSGVLVNEVAEGSAAEKAGLVEGDVITELNGNAVKSSNEIIELIRAQQPGDKVKLTWYRDGKKQIATVELGERKMQSYSYAFGREHGSDGEWNEAPRAFLGVTPGEGEGAVVGSVEAGTAAAKMGLKQGDRITRINDETIDNFEGLSSAVKSRQPGDAVSITLQRAGEELQLSGTLGERRSERSYSYKYDSDEGDGPRSFEFHGMAPEDRDRLRSEMDQLRKEMNELRRERGSDRRVETRITIEAMPLNAEEIALLKSKGVNNLDALLKLGDMRVYPNPSNGFFRLQFDVPESGDLFVNVHDGTGTKVYEERITGFKGRYERTLDLTDKATGNYFLVIEQNGKSVAQKLVKQ